MKEGEYFEGIYTISDKLHNKLEIHQNLRDKKLITTESYGFYKKYCYYINSSGKLNYSENKPKNMKEIPYSQFENWILGKNIKPTYDVY